MNWYYADQGQQRGPVGETELDGLVSGGALAPSALVWTEGMVDWVAYSLIKAARAVPNAASEFNALPRAGFCISCGREVTPHESVVIGRNVACPDCKPVFIERLREAELASLPGALPYAGFWIRYVARMADYTMLTLGQSFFTGTLLVWALKKNTQDPTEMFAVFGITALVGIAVSCTYESLMIGKYGATVGKMLCYLRVVHPDGSRLSMRSSVIRYFCELVTRFFTANVGYIMVAFDVEKRALHDRMAGTRVVNAPPAGFGTTELQPVPREIRCEHCHTEIPPTYWNSDAPLLCPGCSTHVQAIVFPAMSRAFEHSSVQTKEGEGEAGCYYHDTNRATLTCEDCGRFLCPMCDLDSGGRHVCPTCFNGHLSTGDNPVYIQRRTLFDSIALAGAILPILFIITLYFTIFTAPAVIGFSIWSWKKQTSILPRSNWRYVVAILVASGNVLLIGSAVVILFASILMQAAK